MVAIGLTLVWTYVYIFCDYILKFFNYDTINFPHATEAIAAQGIQMKIQAKLKEECKDVHLNHAQISPIPIVVTRENNFQLCAREFPTSILDDSTVQWVVDNTQAPT